jgi:hypothetical protein
MRWRQLVVFVALTTVGTAGCAGSGPPEPAPRELLQHAADATSSVNSAHFSLEQQNGNLQMMSGIRIANAVGDVQGPDHLRMTFTMLLGGGLSAEEQLIVIGGQRFVTNPLTGRWQPSASVSFGPRVLDKEHGLANLLRAIDAPQRAPNELVDTREALHLKGILPASAFEDMLDAQQTTGVVSAEVWVGAEDFVVRIVRLEGPIDEGDDDSAVRTLRLSNVNEPVNIERPTS